MYKEFYYDTNSKLDEINLVKITSNGFTINIDIYTPHSAYYNNTYSSVVETYCCRLRMNVVNGHTYHLAPDIALGGKDSIKQKSKMRTNISFGSNRRYYCNVDLPKDSLICIRNEIHSRILILHDGQAPTFDSYDAGLSLENLIMYVRCPFICPELYRRIINWSRRYKYGEGPILQDLIIRNDCRDPVQQILAQSRIPKVKSLRRISFEDIEGIPLLASISYSFQNVDLIRALYFAFFDCWDDEDDGFVDFSAKLFKTMDEHRGERIAASKLISFSKRNRNDNVYITLTDTIHAYDNLKQCDFDFGASYTIDDLHIYLASSFEKQDIENKQIAYSNKELHLRIENDTFSLMPAKDTYELIDIGVEMNICVGTYYDYAFEKHCTIYVLRNKEDLKPVGCIEMRNGRIVQAKGKYNQLLGTQEMKFINEWIVENDLEVNTMDLPAHHRKDR